MNAMQTLCMDSAGETGEVIFRTPCSLGSGDRVLVLRKVRYFVEIFVLKNPRFEYNGAMQDPNGSHALLAQIDSYIAAATEGDKSHE